LYHFAGKLEMIVMQLLVTQFCRFCQQQQEQQEQRQWQQSTSFPGLAVNVCLCLHYKFALSSAKSFIDFVFMALDFHAREYQSKQINKQ